VPEVRISEVPRAPELVRFRHGFGQRFLVTIDTEEEFDWRAPLAREEQGTQTVPALRKFLQFCDGFGVVPVFLIDYPVAVSSVAADCLREAIRAGRAEVGVQLHPWVSPPHREEVNQFNSFAGNLPEDLERAKFMALRDAIEKNFGAPPRIYRAGRYGVGPNTAAILTDGGIAIDTSVRSYFDYSNSGGPNFRDHPRKPYWLDKPNGLMELPLTTSYWGILRQIGNWLYPRLWRWPWMRGVLSRLSIMERIPFTPEGVTVEEVIHGIDVAVDEGLPVLVFSFHSPSLVPGFTPYVRSEDDLDAFYDWWRQVFAYLSRRGVKATTVAELMDCVELA
jgi:hypothetical protein